MNRHESEMRRNAAIAAAVMMSVAAASQAVAQATWDGAPDGGGASADFNWSTASNWVGDLAPAATGGTLAFDGTTGLANTNDVVTSLINHPTIGRGAITFEAGAGAFTLGGNAMSWETDANGRFIYNLSGNDQVLSMDFADGATGVDGNRDRGISPGIGRTITLNGNINYGNDRLFPEGTAGTIVINGNNTGDGTVGAAAGTNTFRSVIRNNVSGTQVQLGSATALGNASTGTFAAGDLVVRGIVGNQPTLVRAGAALDLSAYAFVVNSGGGLGFNGTENITVGYLINQGGNRDFNINGSNVVTVASTGGIFTSTDQTARQLNVNLASGGGMVVNAPLYTTLHSGGITTTVNSQTAVPVNGIIRFDNGMVTLIADSSTTFVGGEFRSLSDAIVKLGHANAMGSNSTLVDIDAGGTIDLNGFTIGQTFEQLDGTGAGGIGALINSNTTTASAVSTEIVNAGLFTVGGAGDLELNNVRHTAAVNRNLTKVGSGTLTLAGDTSNNRYGLIVNAGTVNLNKTGALAVVNNPLVINAGTVRITGNGGDQINNADNLEVNGGTFDLNGLSEAVGGLNAAAAGGIVTNNGAAPATLFVGGSSGGTADGSFAGTIQDGTAVVSVTKEGSGTQTLSGANTYTGGTTVSGGTLVLENSLMTSSTVGVTDSTLRLASDGSASRVIRTGLVNVAGASGLINLTDNRLITTSPAGTWTGLAYDGVAGYVDSARGSAGNALWDGATGITTTDTRAINNGDLVSIGVAKVSEVRTVADTATTTFAGQTVLGSDTLAMVTWGGDANLDGKINIDDYGRIDGNVGQSGSVFGWSKGDFNYDGKINIDDYGIIDGNINRQGTPFVTGGGAASVALDGVSAVPEPASLSLVALGAMSLMRRRRAAR